MRWEQGRRSDNVEDRRGMPVLRGGVVGGGIGAIVLVLVASYFLGVDPRMLMQVIPQDSSPAGSAEPAPAPVPGADPLADFVSVVLGDTEDTWTAIFREVGQSYEPPALVLFSGAVESACGVGQSAMGPFYCPADRKVYIDLDFYRDLRERFNAPGDFAQAYVIAHEVGHHVQNLLGTSSRVQGARQQASEGEGNALSVRLELQADCYAGVWAAQADEARGILEAGDVEEGLTAASAIGDDRLQRQATGTIAPDSFTHGSSEQRVRWFRRGLETGDPAQCKTFDAREL
ncbi:MAG: flagellar biosynthesis protein FlgM [Gammaproteobacteria bacterium]|nr:flagellar biosynthesis protein FlgM [Gammaproteobacteria bacterium]